MSSVELQAALLPKYLERNGQITNIRSKPLTTAGENYGSILLAVEIDISTENGNKTLYCVAKTVPKNDFIKEFFSSQTTFKKELGFYNSIVPALITFQEEQGVAQSIDCVAEFYGGQLGLNRTLDNFDEHALILLKNLKMEGYEAVPRRVGCDFDTAKLVVKNLAELHAIPIGVKLLKPQEFQANIKLYLNHVNLFAQLGENLGKNVVKDIVDILQENPKCHQYIDRVIKKCKEGADLASNPKPPQEPFATVTHNDFWSNNIMVKRNENTIPENVKIIDYQFIDYGSPAKDLLFFIFDGCQSNVIVHHFQDLIKIYHKYFLKTLQDLKLDTSNFTLDKFLEEIEHAVKNTIVIFQCLTMLRPIFAETDSVNEVENLTAENIIRFGEAPKEHKEKLYLLVDEMAKRKWL